MSKKLTTEEFIEKAIAVHVDRYDYSLVDYGGNQIKIKIVCKKHGIFEQRPADHLFGQGCDVCGGTHKLTTEQFIEMAITVHGDKYDYSLVEYVNNSTKIKIICKMHGVFEQNPADHLSNRGCYLCGKRTCGDKLKHTKDLIIDKFINIHGYRFDYSLVEYININTKVKIICKEHGIFEQSPSTHINGNGCAKCGGICKSNTVEFINKAITKRGNQYDYSLVEYINAITCVKIICKEHGIFQQTPNAHLSGRGCPSCAKTGFDSSKPGYHYYIRFDNINYNSLYKVGVTNLTTNKRLTGMQVNKSWTPTILQELYFENGQDALDLEKYNKLTFKEFQYTGEHILGNGNTELFITDILGLDII